MIKKTIIGILATIGFLYVVLSIFMTTIDNCRFVQKGLISSPDGRYLVRYHQVECENEPAEIEILVGKKNESQSAVIFSAITTTTEKVKLVWTGDNVLDVIYPESLSPIDTRRSVDNIYINYKVLNNDNI